MSKEISGDQFQTSNVGSNGHTLVGMRVKEFYLPKYKRLESGRLTYADRSAIAKPLKYITRRDLDKLADSWRVRFFL